ncbi:MAG TPA: VCBS repeat-containing protein, partial [Pyrinomonadaceae bacterium]|nr:VCBS repeat-containing protein [Pyrinomonadaceae bacterium]
MRLLILFPLILFAFFLNAPAIRAAQCSDIYFNKDARSFFPQFPFGSSSSVAIYGYNYVDINNDGNLDIVATIRATDNSSRLIVFNGDGQGKFQPGAETLIPSTQSAGSSGMKFVHLNNDSTLDLVNFGSSASVFFGNNNGTFAHQNSSQLFSLFPFCCAKLLDVFDVNGDGRKDILVTETGPESGNTFVRLHLAGENYAFPPSGTWIINGAGSVLVEDFNNDGRKDIAATFSFSNFTINVLRFYFNQGNGSFTPSQDINLGAVRKIKLAYDFDGDGWKDFVSAPFSSEPLVAVLYNNANQSFSAVNYPVTLNFAEVSFDLNDFDGDGRKDFAALNERGYNIYLRKRAGGFRRSYRNIRTDPSLIADFNNDKKADILRIGTNYVFQTHAFQLYEADCFRRGRPDTIDYIGNGQANFAVWQPETGRWTYNDAGFKPVNRTVFWGSGALGDVPVPGDYDGDSVTDTAVFRQPTGTWLVNTKTPISFQFGANGDKPVPADFDGDFKTDFAVFRPATGTWLVRLSATERLFTVNFGNSAD